MHHSKNKNLIYLILAVFLISCEGEVGPQGTNSLTNVTTEPAGGNCENGGVKIEVGIDSNANGTLDTDEVLSTSYVCNGIGGAVSLAIVTTEPAGANCENGGVKIESGVDTNGDGTLGGAEISATAYVCNGIDGNNSLTKITNEAAGTNCENGGLKIDSGIDANGDGTLDDSEISATAYVCNGVDGNNSLTKITNEAAGENCENGGLKIDSGVDANGDGTLDDTEISATAYVCNGIDGNNSLTKITNEAAGENCENGGLKIDTGIDTNSDGTLDDSEITASAYVCNGVDGNDGLIKTTNEPAGANCENGGIKIDAGVDTNGDGTLEDTEITATAYVCNGVDGNNSLTKITSEAAGANCENGGLKIDTGVDNNSDGTLDDSEITATAYSCNGSDGNVSLVNITNEATGTNCENGGVKIDSGVDTNGDGTLDAEEIEVTRYICNGIDGGFDEQIRLIIYNNGSSSACTSSSIFRGDLIAFDKRRWIGVDSIIFVPHVWSQNSSFNATAELYDLTNSVAISNSALSTTSTDFSGDHLFSGNIYDDLPNEEIDLTIQLSAENASWTACINDKSYLILYRSN